MCRPFLLLRSVGIASSRVSDRGGKRTLAAALTAAGRTGFLRGVFAGVGSMFAAVFSEGCCKEGILSGSLIASRDAACEDEPSAFMTLVSLL